MCLDTIKYDELISPKTSTLSKIESALQTKGIIGISEVPELENKIDHYIHVTRKFTALSEDIKQKYSPNRDLGETEGYELGAEWFQDDEGIWQTDSNKASFYAYVTDNTRNKWPEELDLKTPYLALGKTIFSIGKKILTLIGMNESINLSHDRMIGYGRMLHYKRNSIDSIASNWCGAHFDHGILTGLIPAHYFNQDQKVDEPEEAGLYIVPNNSEEFIKVPANNKNILIFQAGEFGQLITNDRIRATKHVVKRSLLPLERYTYALFFSADGEHIVNSKSELITDPRYVNYAKNGSISYRQWEAASYEKYRVK
jgi:isopenicillin N synthase-like dioxygenase